jgi:hypothetical protein
MLSALVKALKAQDRGGKEVVLNGFGSDYDHSTIIITGFQTRDDRGNSSIVGDSSCRGLFGCIHWGPGTGGETTPPSAPKKEQEGGGCGFAGLGCVWRGVKTAGKATWHGIDNAGRTIYRAGVDVWHDLQPVRDGFKCVAATIGLGADIAALAFLGAAIVLDPANAFIAAPAAGLVVTSMGYNIATIEETCP